MLLIGMSSNDVKSWHNYSSHSRKYVTNFWETKYDDVYAGISTNPLIKLLTYKLPANCPALSDKP